MSNSIDYVLLFITLFLSFVAKDFYDIFMRKYTKKILIYYHSILKDLKRKIKNL